MADEPHSGVHAFEAGVGDPEGDGVGDRRSVGVEGDRDPHERVQFAHARGKDPFVEEPHCLVVIAGEVDAT